MATIPVTSTVTLDNYLTNASTEVVDTSVSSFILVDNNTTKIKKTAYNDIKDSIVNAATAQAVNVVGEQINTATAAAVAASTYGAGSGLQLNNRQFLLNSTISDKINSLPSSMDSASGADDGTYLNKNGAWTIPINTTYSEATSESSGLISSEDYQILHRNPGLLKRGTIQGLQGTHSAASIYVVPPEEETGRWYVMNSNSAQYRVTESYDGLMSHQDKSRILASTAKRRRGTHTSTASTASYSSGNQEDVLDSGCLNTVHVYLASANMGTKDITDGSASSTVSSYINFHIKDSLTSAKNVCGFGYVYNTSLMTKFDFHYQISAKPSEGARTCTLTVNKEEPSNNLWNGFDITTQTISSQARLSFYKDSTYNNNPVGLRYIDLYFCGSNPFDNARVRNGEFVMDNIHP